MHYPILHAASMLLVGMPKHQPLHQPLQLPRRRMPRHHLMITNPRLAQRLFLDGVAGGSRVMQLRRPCT
jgi:hypothetical protein